MAIGVAKNVSFEKKSVRFKISLQKVLKKLDGTRRARDISGPMAMETRPRVVYLYVRAGRTGSRRHVPTHRHVAT